MDLKDVLEKYPFGEKDVVGIMNAALQCATTFGSEFTIDLLGMASNGGMGDFPEEVEAKDRISKVVCKHPWTWDNVATLVEKVASLVDYFTFEGMMARISPLVDVEPEETRRPCLVQNRKHWFHRWQDRKWIVESSLMVGGSPGGQCSMLMAIVEDQETGQVHEVYPHDIRFLKNLDHLQ